MVRPGQPKPAPWKTDASADPVRFGRRKATGKSSTGVDARPTGVPGEADQWGTTFEASYGADRRSEDRPSYMKDRPGGSNGRAQESMWQTTNSEMGFDPMAAAARGGAQPGRNVMGVGMRQPQQNRAVAPPGGAGGEGGQRGGDDPFASTADLAEHAPHGPIAEAVKCRSKLADPGGSGEADVGGWANVPRMRLRGQDPLGGPDRGRSGIQWGTLHNMEATGEAVATLGATQSGEARQSKPWEQRGVHPGRRKQPVGGSDVLTGLWMSSGQSYGRAFDAFKPDRQAKSNAAKAQMQEQQLANYRPEMVLSTAAVNGFLLDEGGAAEARRLIAEEKAERAKRSGKQTPLSAAEQYKLKQQLRKLSIEGLDV